MIYFILKVFKFIQFNILKIRKFYIFLEPVPDYVQGAVDTVLKIHSKEPSGDILVFLTGQEEVERAIRLLNEHSIQLEHDRKETLLALPLYGSLPNREQLKVFQSTPKGSRKVVVATNLAETSVTIPGIVYGRIISVASVQKGLSYEY